jgi:hypothetical protein
MLIINEVWKELRLLCEDNDVNYPLLLDTLTFTRLNERLIKKISKNFECKNLHTKVQETAKDKKTRKTNIQPKV